MMNVTSAETDDQVHTMTTHHTHAQSQQLHVILRHFTGQIPILTPLTYTDLSRTRVQVACAEATALNTEQWLLSNYQNYNT